MRRIGWCAAERVPELQAFIDAHWKAGHILARDAELLRWQHRRSAAELSVLVADDEDGAMRGILGVIAAPFCARGEKRGGAWLTTWVVPPEERPHQTGLALVRHVVRDADGLVATLGGNAITLRILKALGFTVTPAVPRWVRPVSVSALQALLAAAGAPAELQPLPPRPAPAPGHDVVSYDADAWDAAWHECFAPTVVGTWRDAAYLRWRYLDHPRFRYEVRLARDAAGAARGLLVFRRQPVRDRPEEIVRVLELIGDQTAGDALAAALLDEVDSNHTAFVDFFCTSRAAAAPLERAGFLPEDRLGATFPTLFVPLDPRRTALTGAFWVAGGTDMLGREPYFTRSDCDQDRPN